MLATLYGGKESSNALVPYPEPTYLSQHQATQIMPEALLPILPGLRRVGM